MLTALLFNAAILSVLVIGAVLHGVNPELFYSASQEDRLLEWLTFWAFVLAGAGFLRNARRDYRVRGGLPWFAAGLGLFCLLVGIEEISWGQRLFAYQPPEYFLAENFQQELNLHNIIDTKLRMFAMQLILAGYGVVMSLLAAPVAVRDPLKRWRVVASPPALVPAFAVLAAVHAWYPLDFTGEWVEAAMGLAFLCCAILTGPPVDAGEPARRLAGQLVMTVLLSVATLGVLQLQHGTESERIELTKAEVAALAADFDTPRLRTRCNIHKRLYTFMREYNQPYLASGEFARLLDDGGEPTRAAYLLDPWNSPYWVRHQCTRGRAVAFVYSFGPNRRRDSSEWAFGGDDIGAYLAIR